MTKKIFQPHPLLQPYFECYFTIRTPAVEQDFVSIEELIIPDGTHGILFMLANTIQRYDTQKKQQVQQLRNSYVFGQKTHSVHYHLKANGSNCIGIKLRPNGLSAFTKETMHLLTNDLVEIEAIFGQKIKTLEEQIFNAKTDTAKLEVINNWFIKCLPTKTSDNYLLTTTILGDIHQSLGQISIQSILEKYHIGYKRLERLFKKIVGLTPKAYCCLIRFNAALYIYEQQPKETLTQLAHQTGHFDQMHFIKEIKRFTHLPPKAFFADDLAVVADYQKSLIRQRFE